MLYQLPNELYKLLLLVIVSCPLFILIGHRAMEDGKKLMPRLKFESKTSYYNLCFDGAHFPVLHVWSYHMRGRLELKMNDFYGSVQFSVYSFFRPLWRRDCFTARGLYISCEYGRSFI